MLKSLGFLENIKQRHDSTAIFLRFFQQSIPILPLLMVAYSVDGRDIPLSKLFRNRCSVDFEVSF